MSIISCPECGRQVSSSASSCPSCGYPIAGSATAGFAIVITPDHVEGFRKPLFRKEYISISGDNTKWFGEMGDVATVDVSAPTKVFIDMGNNVEPFHGVIIPGKNYELRYLGKDRWGVLARYALVEL